MKALTLHQPWAWCIIHGPKRVENRSWRPFSSLLGKRILIHAGNTFDHEGHRWILKTFPQIDPPKDPAAFQRGALIGTVELVGIELENPGNDPWWFGPIGWRLANPEPLERPVLCHGSQGLWEYRFSTEGERP